MDRYLLPRVLQSRNEGERDMIILHHDFVAKFPQGKKRITSTLIEYGIENGDSAMARTVGLPAAIGVELVLKEKIVLPSVKNINQ